MIYNSKNTNTIVLMIAFNKITDFCICNKILNKFVKQIGVQNFTQKYFRYRSNICKDKNKKEFNK